MTDRDDEGAASGVPERTERTDSGRHVTDSGRHITNRNVVPRTVTGREDSGPRDIRLPGSPNRPGHSDDAFDVVTPVVPEPRDVYDEADVTLSHHDELDDVRPFRPASHPRLMPPRRAPTERGHVEPRRRPSTPPVLPRDADPDAEPTEPIRPRRSSKRIPRPSRMRRPSSAQTRVAPPLALDRALRIVTVLAVLGLGAAGLAQPGSMMRGGTAWLAALFFVLAGWGTLVSWLARLDEPDLGLRMALGAAGYLAIAGLQIATGILSAPVILGLISVGIAAFAWRELTAPTASWHRIRDALIFARDRPALGALVAVMVVLAGVRLLGAVCAQSAGPSDDLAYTALVKRLLDAGNLVEPFSFHRLGGYGGQTALHALAGARGTLVNLHLIDRGLGFGVALLVMVGHARERRTQPLWLAVIALVLLVLPDNAVDTTSSWTAVMLFLALYRCVARDHWPLAGLCAAAIATLGQGFVIPAAVLVASALIARLIASSDAMPLAEAWRADRGRWAWCIGVGLAVIAPWWIAAYRSSHTFLFPLVDGTWNHELALRPQVITWSDEIAFLVRCCLESPPFPVIPILALVLPFIADRRPGRPLVALILASLIGLVALVIGGIGSEPSDVWRHAFGFSAALAVALGLELGAVDEDATVEIPPLGRWIALAAFALQLVSSGRQATGHATALMGDLRAAAAIDRGGDPGADIERRRYAAMQAAIPDGERAVVMLDDPALLDYRRNAIAAVDHPGLASPGEPLPAFRGAEALREHLVASGYRYAAFTRSERSRTCCRRERWVEQTFTGAELRRTISAYATDAIDSFAELATTTTVRHDVDGLVVLDLASPQREASRRAALGDEPTRRTAWTRELADREHLHDAWSLTSRADLRFEDGFGPLRFIDGSVDDPRWYEISHSHSPAARGTAMRPVQRRAHLRVRGDGPRHLVLRAAIALHAVHTHPRLDVSLDGEALASVVADASGKYAVDAAIPGDHLLGDWHDLYLVFTSLADPGADAGDIRIARLESLEWSAP